MGPLRTSAVIALSLVPLASAAAASAAVRYTIQDLGAAPRPAGNTPQGRGYALNDAGFVVGSSNVNNPNGNTAPYAFPSSGPVPVATPNNGTFGFAYGVNNSGEIVGYASGSGIPARAFVTTGSTTKQLGSLTGSQTSYGYAINQAAAAAGYYNGGPSGVTRGFTYDPTTNGLTELGTIQGTATSRGMAYGLNDGGVAVGNSDYNSSVRHATVYNVNGTVTDVGAAAVAAGFGALNLASTAYAINDAGVVVGGFNTTSSASSAFAYDTMTGAFRNLGVPAGNGSATAYGINADGTVVGTAGTTGAFVADGSGIYTLFNLVDNAAAANFADLVEARGINTSGQIAGYGDVRQADGSTQYHAFLLTPTAAVPEPASAGLLAAAAVGLLGSRPRRRRA